MTVCNSPRWSSKYNSVLKLSSMKWNHSSSPRFITGWPPSQGNTVILASIYRAGPTGQSSLFPDWAQVSPTRWEEHKEHPGGEDHITHDPPLLLLICFCLICCLCKRWNEVLLRKIKPKNGQIWTRRLHCYQLSHRGPLPSSVSLLHTHSFVKESSTTTMQKLQRSGSRPFGLHPSSSRFIIHLNLNSTSPAGPRGHHFTLPQLKSIKKQEFIHPAAISRLNLAMKWCSVHRLQKHFVFGAEQRPITAPCES